MDNFLEKWRSDDKYRAKIKLTFYVALMALITIYAISLNNNIENSLKKESDTTEKT